MKVASPGRKDRRRKTVAYAELDGPSWAQANKIQRKEEDLREQWAADEAAEDNAVAAVLNEEKSWYWERKKAPYCMLAMPVGEESPNAHWQALKDPDVRALPPPCTPLTHF